MPRLGPPQSASIVGRPEAVEQAGTDTHACSDSFTRLIRGTWGGRAGMAGITALAYRVFGHRAEGLLD